MPYRLKFRIDENTFPYRTVQSEVNRIIFYHATFPSCIKQSQNSRSEDYSFLAYSRSGPRPSPPLPVRSARPSHAAGAGLGRRSDECEPADDLEAQSIFILREAFGG